MLLVVGLLTLPYSLHAELRIHEIYPAPPSGEDEWVELYNDGGESISLERYSVTDENGTQLSFAGQSISPGTSILALSRSVLNNDGDTVFLMKDGTTIDTVTYTERLTASASYAYCAEIEPHWNIAPATKGLTNDSACSTLISTPPSAVPTLEPTSFPSGLIPAIIISEIMPNPETDENEWIELYNNSDTSFMANLLVDDGNASGKPITVRASLEAHKYTLIESPAYMFNNDGDIVRIRSGIGKPITSVSYPAIEKGFSWGRQESGLYCIMNPSKGAINNTCQSPTPLPEPTPTRTPSPTRTPTQFPTPTPTVHQRAISGTVHPIRNIPTARIFRTVSSASESSAAGSVKGASIAEEDSPNTTIPLYLLIAAACMAILAGTVAALKIRSRITGY